MATLEKLREDIDKLDDELISILSQRLKLGSKIIELKKNKNMVIEDFEREEEIISRLVGKSKIDEALLNELYFNIFDHINNS